MIFISILKWQDFELSSIDIRHDIKFRKSNSRTFALNAYYLFITICMKSQM